MVTLDILKCLRHKKCTVQAAKNVLPPPPPELLHLEPQIWGASFINKNYSNKL